VSGLLPCVHGECWRQPHQQRLIQHRYRDARGVITSGIVHLSDPLPRQYVSGEKLFSERLLSTRPVGKNNAERRCRRCLVADGRSPSRPSWELSPRGRSGRRQPYYDAVVAVPEAVAVDDTIESVPTSSRDDVGADSGVNRKPL